jgi:hypothetical protein
MFSLSDGTLLLGNPRALENLVRCLDEARPKRPLI